MLSNNYHYNYVLHCSFTIYTIRYSDNFVLQIDKKYCVIVVLCIGINMNKYFGSFITLCDFFFILVLNISK